MSPLPGPTLLAFGSEGRPTQGLAVTFPPALLDLPGPTSIHVSLFLIMRTVPIVQKFPKMHAKSYCFD